jgi:hypothetical protein
VKFLRHLSAVLLVVAVLVVASVLWAHASGGGIARSDQSVPAHAVMARISLIKAGRFPVVRPDDGIHFSQVRNLVRTGLIEAALAAMVVAIGIVLRRRRRTSSRLPRG